MGSHKPFYYVHKLVDDIVFAVFDISYNTPFDVILQKLTVESVHGRAYGGGLSEDIGAVCVVLKHFLDTSHLTLDTVESVYKLAFIFIFTLCFVVKGTFAGIFHYNTSNIPRGGIYSIPQNLTACQ